MKIVSGPKARVEVVWTAEYVRTIRPSWSIKRCVEELMRVWGRFRELQVERGWPDLEILLPKE